MTSDTVRVLVVEDEVALAERLALGMRAEGFTVELATRADEGMRLTIEDPPDAIVLDLALPDRSGFEVLEQIQGRCVAPVIVLTVHTDLRDRLRCFEFGAADYMAKPFYFEELVARIRLSIRARKATPGVVSWADVTVDIRRRTVLVGGVKKRLTRSEFDILTYLIERPGVVVSRPTLAKRMASDSLVWSDVRTVDAHLSRVRRKLGKAATAIVTVRSIGFRFDPF
jgi:two-component system catabolic regulation response regulator CreB